jgi:hypothetical protein
MMSLYTVYLLDIADPYDFDTDPDPNFHRYRSGSRSYRIVWSSKFSYILPDITGVDAGVSHICKKLQEVNVKKILIFHSNQ